MNNLEQIKHLLASKKLIEGESIEFKKVFPSKDENMAKCVVGFANTQGGYIIIGVCENQNGISIVGQEEDLESLQLKFKGLVDNYTTGVLYSIYLENINEKNIAFIKVEKSDEIVYFTRKATSPERMTAYQRTVDGTIKPLDETTTRKLYKKVYKYMTLEAFLISLYNKNWRFFEPKKWNDKFERRFYCAKYQLPNFTVTSTPLLYATCVTRAQNNEAAWKVYSHGQGLGTHCVQLELDIVELRKELNSSNLLIEERAVDYKSENYILNLHKKETKHYSEYFDNFDYRKFLKLLTLKREAYSHEQEVRLFAKPKEYTPISKGKQCLNIDLHIEWNNVIKKVRIDHSCSDAELVAIQQACFSAGINPVIKGYTFISNMPKPQKCVDIEFVRFDIDAMPGSQKIVIK